MLFSMPDDTLPLSTLPIDLQAPLSPTAAVSSTPGGALASPGSAGRAWRERLHVALERHRQLTPEALLDKLLEVLPTDPVGVFKLIISSLPKEIDITTQPQQMHLTMVRLVAQAKARGINLDELLDPAGALASADDVPDFLR